MTNYVYTYNNSKTDARFHKNQQLYCIYYVSLFKKLNNAQYILIDENLYSEYLLLNSGHINADQEYLNQYELTRLIRNKS